MNDTLLNEILKTVTFLDIQEFGLSRFEALKIATKIQQNRVLQDALLVGDGNTLSAIETITLELKKINKTLNDYEKRNNGIFR
jgi:hypothetical protein